MSIVVFALLLVADLHYSLRMKLWDARMWAESQGKGFNILWTSGMIRNQTPSFKQRLGIAGDLLSAPFYIESVVKAN